MSEQGLNHDDTTDTTQKVALSGVCCALSRRLTGNRNRLMSNSAPIVHKRCWQKRTVVLGAALLVCAVVSLGWIQLREARQAELIAEIRAAGGKVRDSWSLMSRLQYWRERGVFPTNLRLVNLSESSIDDEWLRDHDWLAGLDVQSLLVDGSVTGSGLSRLIATHPLEELYIDRNNFTDDVVAALSRKSSLKKFGPAMCRLSDDQFERLPLENYEYLSLIETDITPAGLQQLLRCSRLKTICLDGNQFTPETAKLVASLGTVEWCLLYGKEITDVDLDELPQIKSIKDIGLQNTQTTPEGVAALKAAMPGVTIERATSADP